jgi:hypothetical protein
MTMASKPHLEKWCADYYAKCHIKTFVATAPVREVIEDILAKLEELQTEIDKLKNGELKHERVSAANESSDAEHASKPVRAAKSGTLGKGRRKAE